MTEDVALRRVHLFVLGAALGVVLALHHGYRTYVLYVAPAASAAAGIAAAVAGVATGVLAAWWLTPFAERAVSRAFLVTALAAVLASFAPFCAFASRFSLSVAVGTIACLVAAAIATGELVRRAAGRASVALGLVPFLLTPARLFFSLAALLLLEAVAARTGFLRSGLGIAAVLAVSNETYPRVRAFLDGAPLGPRRASWVRRAALIAALGSALAVAESLLPAEWLGRFPDEIVFSLDGSTSEYAVVASPAGYELYVDRQLAVSPLDEPRRIAALVRPALAAARRAERVLLLYGGLGAVERALLADPRVKELVTVTPDAVRANLGRELPFLVARSEGTTRSPRLHAVVAEPLAWLGAHRGAPFDVIIADLPLPLGYREGKYYTRFAFDRFRAALAPDGVVVVPGVGDDALAGVTATLKSAGLAPTAYHAAVPTLGIAAYVLASPRGEPDVSAPWLDHGADLRRTRDDRIATLSDQWIVGAFEAARDRR